MGADMCLLMIPVKSSVKLSSAMKRCINAVKKSTDRKALSEWYEENIGRVEDEVLPGQLVPGLSMDRLRMEAISVIEEAFNSLGNRDVTYFDIKGITCYITGGMSWGDSPSDTFDVFDRFLRLPRTIVRAGTAL